MLLRDKFKTKYIFFVDSVFNDDDGAYLEVIDEMVRREVSHPLDRILQAGGLTDEIVERMKKTGFARCRGRHRRGLRHDAQEDGQELYLQRRQSQRNDLFVRHGIATSHFFMFGGPGETAETVQEGIRNILSLQKCVAFIFMGIRILPNTPLARLAIKENLIKPEDGLLKPVYYISPTVDKTVARRNADQGVRGCAPLRVPARCHGQQPSGAA